MTALEYTENNIQIPNQVNSSSTNINNNTNNNNNNNINNNHSTSNTTIVDIKNTILKNPILKNPIEKSISNTNTTTTPPQSPCLALLINNTPLTNTIITEAINLDSSNMSLAVTNEEGQDEEDDEDDEEDTSLLPMIQTPPQSTASSVISIQLNENPISNTNGLNSLNINKDLNSPNELISRANQNSNFNDERLTKYENIIKTLKQNQLNLKQNLSESFKRLRNIQTSYLISSTSSLNKNEINYELLRKREDDNTVTDDDEDEDGDDDNNTNCNQEAKNDSSNYWSLNRIKLGSEWQRVQSKLKLLKVKNSNLNKLTKNNSINSNRKTSIRRRNNTEESYINLLNQSLVDYEPSLDYFRTNLFKYTCLCDLNSNLKTCIFCYLFKTKSNNQKTTTTTTTTETKVIDDTNNQASNNKLLNNYNHHHNNQNLVDFDHSYSKKPLSSSSVNLNCLKLASTNTNKSTSKTSEKTNKKRKNIFDAYDFDIDFENDNLLNNLANDRLNVLFNTNSSENKINSKKLKNDDSIINNVYPDLNNIKQLPNLSVEELLFLFDDIPHSDDNDINITLDSNELNKPSKSSYSNLTKKKTLNNNNIRHEGVEIDGDVNCQKQDRMGRKYDQSKFKQLRYINSQMRIKNKKPKRHNNTNRRDSRTTNNNNNNNENLNPIRNTRSKLTTKKRNSRSSSSNSSIRSVISYTDSGSCHLASSNDKFDINNIIIPNEMLTCNKITLLKAQNVETPKFREVNLEVLSSEPKQTVNTDSIESFEDSVFVNRHELIELHERYCSLTKKSQDQDNSVKNLTLDELRSLIEKLENENLKKNRTLSLTCSNQNDTSIQSSLEWPIRSFPIDNQEYEQMIEQDQQLKIELRSYSSITTNSEVGNHDVSKD